MKGTKNDRCIQRGHLRLVQSLHSQCVFSVVCVLGTLILHSSSSHVTAADSPLAVIRVTIEQVTTVVQKAAYQGAAHRQERFAQVRALVLLRFDTLERAKRTLCLQCWESGGTEDV